VFMLNSWQAVLLSVVCVSLSSVPLAVNGSTLEGRVVGRDGHPIKGADVRLQKSSASLASFTRTDVRGQYRFTNVVPGKYKVSVSSANTVQRLPDVMVDGNKRVDLEVSAINSDARTNGKHRVWIPPPTGTYIGGRWAEVDDTGASLAGVFKGNLNNVPGASVGVPKNAASSVVGGTQGAFNATQIGTKPGHPH
jgi:carboxypeptidase family protein